MFTDNQDWTMQSREDNIPVNAFICMDNICRSYGCFIRYNFFFKHAKIYKGNNNITTS